MDITGLLTETMSVVTPEWWRTNWDELVKIIMIDVVLAGDNAIVVGLAASRVSADAHSQNFAAKGSGGRCSTVLARITRPWKWDTLSTW